MLGEHVVNEEMGQLLGVDGFFGSGKDGLLGQHTHEGDNGVVGDAVVGSGGREVGDEVHRNMRPGADGDGMRLKKARRTLS